MALQVAPLPAPEVEQLASSLAAASVSLELVVLGQEEAVAAAACGVGAAGDADPFTTLTNLVNDKAANRSSSSAASTSAAVPSQSTGGALAGRSTTGITAKMQSTSVAAAPLGGPALHRPSSVLHLSPPAPDQTMAEMLRPLFGGRPGDTVDLLSMEESSAAGSAGSTSVAGASARTGAASTSKPLFGPGAAAGAGPGRNRLRSIPSPSTCRCGEEVGWGS